MVSGTVCGSTGHAWYVKYHNYFYLCQNSWKWFIYTRTQNVNSKSTSSDGPSTKSKFSDPSKHAHPFIPDRADDNESVKRNFALLKEESLNLNLEMRC